MSFVTLSNTTIESGKLYSDFIAFLYGPPLSDNDFMLWVLQHYATSLFCATDASTEVVLLSLIFAQRYLAAAAAAAASGTSVRSVRPLPSTTEEHYLLATVSCRLAFKWHDDRHMWWSEVDWDLASGLADDVIDKFEWDFVKAINYELFVSEADFNTFASTVEMIVVPPPSPPSPQPQQQQDPLDFIASSSPPLVPVKLEPPSPMPTIKLEPESPRFLPYVHVKVEELDDSSALLASMAAHEDYLRSVSMPVATPTPNITHNDITRFSV